MKLKKLIFNPTRVATPPISTTPPKSWVKVSRLIRTWRKKSRTSKQTERNDRSVVRGPSSSMSWRRSEKMTFSPVASTRCPSTGTFRTLSTKAFNRGASSSRASGRAVTAARRPTVPSFSRKRSRRVAGAWDRESGCWARSSALTCRSRGRCASGWASMTASERRRAMSRMRASFRSWSTGTTLDTVSHPSSTGA